MILNGNLVFPLIVLGTLQDSPASNRILLWSCFLTDSSSPVMGTSPPWGFCATGRMAIKRRFNTWKRFTRAGPVSPFRKSVNLPLSQGDKQEISNAYEKAAAEIKASAASLDDLAEMLGQKIACLDPGSRKPLDDSLTVVSSSLFKLRTLCFKVQNANLQGREFSALDPNLQEP